MSGKIKVLLIEDSGFMRIVLSDLLRNDKDIELIATANNGRDGVEKAKALQPQVVITDMIMPNYDGLYVVKTLMQEHPLPIILLSSLDRADPQIFDALKEGAFDFLDKPADATSTKGYSRLTELVHEASMTNFQKLTGRFRGRNAQAHTFEAKLNYDIVVIGASTGGPGAVEFVVNNLPKNLAIPVIIAQHMPDRFIESFAGRLKDETGLNMSVAASEETLLPNHLYLAPGTSNIRIVKKNGSHTVRYVDEHFKEFNCPSIDCLMDSIADAYGKRAIGVILTGMGKDGTAGLMKMKLGGCLTITQDEKTSVVYGMPKSAFESGAASHQMALQQIPNFIVSAL
jgi:two-component system, chemotaxis family, protein-glutamate methylesterase/glutaminase